MYIHPSIELNEEQEVWKNIPNSVSQQVSNMGRVRNKIKDRFVHQSYATKSYLCFAMDVNGGKVKTTTKVHSVVMKTFKPNRPLGFVIDHINNNKNDNRLINLQYVSNRYNIIKQKINSGLYKYVGVQKKSKSTYSCEFRLNGSERKVANFKKEEDALLFYYKELLQIDKSCAKLLKQTYSNIIK